ncbi:ABC1 kinase family protein [Kibdelosporangium phytohabitans]|uniref:Ubiquinone biosynthesis protein UbiB n=1 Tax=Kibdelosporangium phytohabitans TaxID=860235 RepID=A0A0N9I017_9PSEU|nr:AarF/UbiB family protein [Kibdelosporangium phytohabitans]ALG09005.1 ubiquinone biosynthesis protein UbiB [Kibdelosporangium phytohabitans]MBE1469817.1 ubiquinone biosynthesis protein [Kibdelosporangium phytohabitans]
MQFVLLFVAGLVTLVLSAWILVAGARKVLGVRVGTIRAVIAAFAAWSVAGFIGGRLPQMYAQGQEQAFLLFIIPVFGGTLLVAVAILFVLEVMKPSGTGMWFVGGLRAIPGRISRARRYSRITRIAIKHGLGPALRGRLRTSDPVKRAQVARSLRQALEEAGVTFVKLGQVLSTRSDLLPTEFVEELSRLQDQVSPAPREAIDAVLREELGEPDQVFTEIDTVALASASVAQVYKATLTDGTDAVVKVQRPGIRSIVERDLDIMYRLATTLEERTQWARRLGVLALADGFAKALLEELDFRVEAKNIQAVAADTTVRVPVVHRATTRVLIMDRLAGTPLGSAGAQIDARGLDRDALARSLLHCLLRQVMRNGVFHADPHPGNVMLLDNGQLGLLDFGSVGRLDGSLRTGLQNLLVAIDRGDPAALRDGLLEVVSRPDDIDEQKLERALGQFIAQHFTGGTAPDVEMFTDLFRLVTAYGLSVPPEIAAVFRALATMEGTLAGLAPGFNIVAESRSYASVRLTEQMDPASLRKTATEELLTLLPVLRRLPRRIDRIGGALEEGRLSVNVRLFADERDRKLITGIVHQVLLAFIGATTGIMAVMLLGTTGGPRLLNEITLYQVFGYNLLVISVLIGLRLLFNVFRNQR